MSYRRPYHHPTGADDLPFGLEPIDADNEIIGLFIVGPIGALVGQILAATVKSAGSSEMTPVPYEDIPLPVKPKPKPGKARGKKKPKPTAGNSSKPAGRKRRKPRPQP